MTNLKYEVGLVGPHGPAGTKRHTSWEVVLAAPSVSTDGTQGPKHSVVFATLKVTKATMRLSWATGSITRPGNPGTSVLMRSGRENDVPLFRVSARNDAQVRAMRKLADRLSFLLEPQRFYHYSPYDALVLCRSIRALLTVQKVMEE